MADLIVGDGGFGTIQAAVDAAGDGDTIIVAAGTYVEQVIVQGRNGLTIRAADGEQVTLRSPANLVETARSSGDREIHAVLTVKDSSNIAVQGIDVDGDGRGTTVDEGGGAGIANFYGIFYRNASGGLTDVDITGVRDPYPGGTTPGGQPEVDAVQRGIAVVADNDSLLAFAITGGTISDFQKQAGLFSRADLTVTGVTVTGGGAQPVMAQNGFSVTNSTGIVSGNTFSGIGYAGPAQAYSGAILASSNTDLAITGNTITGSNGDSTAAKVVGIWVYVASAANNGVEISGNTISGVDVGINASGNFGANGILIRDNDVTDLDLADPYAYGVNFDPLATLPTAFEVDGSARSDILRGAAGGDTLSGLGGKDEIIGRGGDDLIDGGAGDDVLDGNDGDDRLEGGSGDDDLDGGAGSDTVSFSTAAAGVTVDLAVTGPQDTGAGSDLIINIENALGSDFADYLRGNADANRLFGGAGADRLFGSAGADRLRGEGGDDVLDGGIGIDDMAGGAGDDLYVARETGDVATEADLEGHDAVRSTADYTLGDHVEDLYLQGIAVSGTGNDLDNLVVGTNGANVLAGLGGSDILRGYSGVDELNGGAGADTFYGGLGNDDLDGGSGNDRLNGEGGADFIEGGDDDDHLFGRDGADELIGGQGMDRLEGGAQSDTLTGGADLDFFGFGNGDVPGTRASADRITDFSQAEGDRIHLRQLDANLGLADDQNFQFIGESQFSGKTGELRFDQVGGDTYVQGDVDGDRAADFFIRVDGIHSLAATDFVL
jgi:Ca2+-binding RTX toxin-like protein